MDGGQQALSQQECPDLSLYAVRVAAEEGEEARRGLALVLHRALVGGDDFVVTP